MAMAKEEKIKLFAEHRDLNRKIVNLDKFINGDVYPTLDDDEKADLAAQMKHMQAYQTVLSRRVDRNK